MTHKGHEEMFGILIVGIVSQICPHVKIHQVLRLKHAVNCISITRQSKFFFKASQM